MSRVKFRIRLKQVHDKTGLSGYAVAQKTALAENTVRKYVDNDEVISASVFGVVIELCNFYGVDWRDPKIIQPFIEGEENSDEGIQQEALSA